MEMSLEEKKIVEYKPYFKYVSNARSVLVFIVFYFLELF